MITRQVDYAQRLIRRTLLEMNAYTFLVEAALDGIGERFACTGGIRHPLGRHSPSMVAFATLVEPFGYTGG
jgi:hypothetical protein